MILVILDYGSGNLKSVYNSIWRAVKDNNLNHKIIVSNKVNDIKRGDYIILPGVGSYANCMKHLVDKPGLLEHLEDFVLYKKKPFLGICVGMQLMAEYGLENGKTNGLGWIKGIVKHLDWFGNCKKNKLKIPHMGWNNIEINNNNSRILNGIKDNDYFYFVHSYKCIPTNYSEMTAFTKYGQDICAVIEKNNIFATQFHPEKSGKIGLKIYQNFLSFIETGK